jgi:predicted CxxxxCH...CXXCH cytochrome family protein
MSRTAKQSTLVLLLAGIIALAMGCSSSNNKESGSFDLSTGRHSTNWSSPDVHGASAKLQSNGFAICQECHAANFSGGISSKSCFTCHGVSAPHAPAPWRGGIYTHTNTNQGNAPICAQCHANGANSSLVPVTPAPLGTTPGCFNNTLCHAVPGHPTGWSAPTQHGVSAKAANGFSTCESCHATDFTGGIARTACSSCHGVSAPHPPKPWRDAATYTHTTTDTSNAPVCAQCHANGANSSLIPVTPAPAGTAPGCFNNTLCHTQAGHPTGWSAPTQHGVAAETDFSACKSCHGADYTGGSAAVSCFTCHAGPGLDHPASSWVVFNHKTAALAGNTSCKKCHGTNFLGGGAHVACNSCHMENETKVHRVSWYGAGTSVVQSHPAYAAVNGTASCSNVNCHGTNLTGVTNSGPPCTTCHSWPYSGAACGSCHAIPPSGSAFPNTAGRHAVHTGLGSNISCETCHTGAGSGTVNHKNGAVEVTLATMYAAKSGGTTSFNATANTCSNVSCHGGQTTPNWLTGTIDVTTNAGCASCHASGTGQYNSYNSGRHSVSNHVSKGCIACHDTTSLATDHFTHLDTTVMEGPASATIKNAVQYNGNTCNPSNGGLSGCHGSKSW